ncbi:MAG: FHA domain-containing protein, partial [Blastocatellia bacterium]
MLRIIIQSGSLAGQEFQLEPGDRSHLMIGRHEESAVRLAEPVVSSRHAIIAADGADFYLLDQRSTNGTFLNGTRVEQAKLQDGDVIELGAQGPRMQVLIESLGAARRGGSDATVRQRNLATARYHAPLTMRLGLHDTAHNLGLYNPDFD